VKELLHYWRRHPPTHLMLGMIGRALGLKPGEGREPAPAGSQDQAAAWRDLREQAADPMSGLAIHGDAPK
jgi:hypothetical protein